MTKAANAKFIPFTKCLQRDFLLIYILTVILIRLLWDLTVNDIFSGLWKKSHCEVWIQSPNNKNLTQSPRAMSAVQFPLKNCSFMVFRSNTLLSLLQKEKIHIFLLGADFWTLDIWTFQDIADSLSHFQKHEIKLIGMYFLFHLTLYFHGIVKKFVQC